MLKDGLLRIIGGSAIVGGAGVAASFITSNFNSDRGRPRRDGRPAVPGPDAPARGTVDRADACADLLRGAGRGLLGAPAATIGRGVLGDRGLWLGLLPVVLATPFALPWLDPPAEHGLLKLAVFLGRKVAGTSPGTACRRGRTAVEANGLRAFLRVVNAYRRRETLGCAEQPDLAGLTVADGVVAPGRRRRRVRAVYRVRR